MPDLGLLQTPNFAQAALSGYQAGQALGRQKRLDGALASVDLSKPESIVPVLQIDPHTGMGLLQASTQLATAHREAAGREALGGYLMSRLGKGGGQASGVTQGGATMAAPPGPSVTTGSPTDANGDIVVTAPSAPRSDPEADLLRADPEKWLDIQDNLGKLDENHRKALSDAADAYASVGYEAAKLPYDQRKAFIQQQASYLTAHGVSADEVAAFDPTDANIQAQVTRAMGVKERMVAADREADNARQDRNVDSEIASRGLRDGLAIHADARDGARLGLARNADARAERGDRRAAASVGGKAGGGVGGTAGHYEYRTVNGVTQKRLVK